MMSGEHRHDVIIVGAGIAGLTAAHLLLKSRPDLDVLMVEAKDRVGGRVLSKPMLCADGQSRNWCFGGAWISRNQRHLLALMEEFGIETFEQFKQGTKFVELDANVTQYEGGGYPTIGLLNLVDLDLTLRALERQAASLKSSPPDSVANMDLMSVRDTVRRMTYRQDSELFLLGVVGPVLQGSDEHMSQVHALNVAQSSGGFEKLFKNAQELRVDGGAQQLTDRLAESVGQTRLRLGWPLTEVSQDEDAGEVHLVSESGGRLSCRLLLCTLPLAGLRSVRFSPELPPDKQVLANSCPGASSTLKTIITYASAFWRLNGFSGEILSCRGKPTDPGAACGPISVCYDATTRDGAHAALVILASTGADRTARPEERKRALLNHLARFYPRDKVYDYVDYVEHEWFAEPYHTTCMASPVPVGCGSLMLGPGLSRPLQRVHFAGSDLANEWVGYMEGAVQSAKRAVSDMLQAL